MSSLLVLVYDEDHPHGRVLIDCLVTIATLQQNQSDEIIIITTICIYTLSIYYYNYCLADIDIAGVPRR